MENMEGRRELEEASVAAKMDMVEDEADPVLLETLVAMGMNEYLSARALRCTANKSLDAALSWIAELGAEEMEVLCGMFHKGGHRYNDEADNEVYYKMVFVVNTELGMGMGKVAAQVGHGCLGLHRLLKMEPEKYQTSTEEWEGHGERMIALRGTNSQHLIDLQKKAEEYYLPTYLVEDAGATQVAAGSITVLAIFGDEMGVNEVTGKLKLL